MILGVVFSAAAWGMLASILMPSDPVAQMIVIVIIAGVSAGGIQSLSIHLFAAISFVVLMIFPLCIWLFVQAKFEYTVLGMTMVIYLLFMIMMAFRGNKLLVSRIKMHYLNLSLVEHLTLSHQFEMQVNNQLKESEFHMTAIMKMNDLLQLCQNSSEAFSVIKKSAENLFPDCSGGLTINNLGNQQKIAVQWGKCHLLQPQFPSNNCWAYRSANEYDVEVDDPSGKLICQHYLETPSGFYICIPLMLHSRIMGILNFYTKGSNISLNTRQAISLFSDTLKLSLANIQLQEKLQQEATHDPLTNLYNRRFLNETLPRELKRLTQENQTLCVAMFDLDNFKQFNDKYGHDAGDEVLKFVANILIQNSRGNDIACRFGGEEFIVVFVNTQIQKVYPYLEKIRKEINKVKLYYEGGFLPQITISIGVSEAPTHGLTSERIIRCADKALYAAKEAGKDQIAVAQEGSS